MKTMRFEGTVGDCEAMYSIECNIHNVTIGLKADWFVEMTGGFIELEIELKPEFMCNPENKKGNKIILTKKLEELPYVWKSAIESKIIDDVEEKGLWK
jgi:hypothetical protein